MIAFITRGRARAVVCLAVLAVKSANAQSGDDSVLRALLSGTLAWQHNDTVTALHGFDQAVTSIAAVWGDTPEARRARSLWYEESVKPFKGDPYERMMAFYYRGVIALAMHDWGNAQAAFRSSVQQDAFAEEDSNNDDVAISLFLQGWALQAQGSTGSAREAYRILRNRRPDFVSPNPDSAQPNVLIIAESGTAPRKVPDGVGSYKLRIFRGKSIVERRAVVMVDSSDAVPLYPMEDVYWQAVSRGGRVVDAWFEGKARFASVADNVGSTLTAAAEDLTLRRHLSDGSTSGRMTTAGNAAEILGIAALALSIKAKPAVDTRYWDNLPDAIHVAMLNLAPGEHNLVVAFRDSAGNDLPQFTRRLFLRVPMPGTGPTLVWASARDRQSAYLNRFAPK